jgi:hypothetical protein
LASCNMLKLFNFGVICYEIKNGRHFLVWLATWGGSLPGQALAKREVAHSRTLTGLKLLSCLISSYKLIFETLFIYFILS